MDPTCHIRYYILFGIILQASCKPFFISNPFASTNIAEEESQNINVYTTSKPRFSNETAKSPSVYLRFVKGVYDEIRSPFMQIEEQTSKIVSTIETPLSMEESIEFSNSTEYDSEERKEDLDPNMIEMNPSFKIKPLNEGRPERIVLSSDLEKENIETADPKINEIESEESEDEEDDTTEKTNNGSKRYNENGFVLVLEYVASAITLVWGAINTMLQPKM